MCNIQLDFALYGMVNSWGHDNMTNGRQGEVGLVFHFSNGPKSNIKIIMVIIFFCFTENCKKDGSRSMAGEISNP